MKGNRKKPNKEKIFSVIISFAIIMTLSYGIYSVAATAGKAGQKENIVNLDAADGESSDVAIRTEDGQKQEPDVLDLRQANAGAKAETVTAKETKVQPEKEVIPEKKTQENKTEAVTEKAAAASSKNVSSKYHFADTDTFSWPVKGDIVLKYSMDTTIYFQTLGVYKCNPAIVIAAATGTNVGVVADGIVESVTYNEETGNTVAISIGDGYVTTYGQLKDIVVKQGDTVVAGQLLGTIAAPTAYYTQEGENLYFKMTKDGNPVDPVAYFEEP